MYVYSHGDENENEFSEGEEVLSTQFHFNAPAQCECACIQFNIYIVEHIIYLFTLMDGAQGAVAKAK